MDRESISVEARPSSLYHETHAVQVAEAAEQANAHTFIEAFPDGYRTLVGERGVQVGHWSTVSIS